MRVDVELVTGRSSLVRSVGTIDRATALHPAAGLPSLSGPAAAEKQESRRGHHGNEVSPVAGAVASVAEARAVTDTGAPAAAPEGLDPGRVGGPLPAQVRPRPVRVGASVECSARPGRHPLTGGMPDSSPHPAGLEIAEVDIARDEARLHAGYTVLRDGYRAEQPPYPLDPEAETTAGLRSLDPSRMVARLYLATVRGEPAGIAVVGHPQRDNRGSARANHLVVHPDHRRSGVGRSLLDAVVVDARAAGRSVLLGEFRQESPSAPSSGRAFAEAVGAVSTGRSLEQVLDLATVTATDVERLRVQALAVAPAAARYDILRWADRVPDDLLDAWAALRGRMSTDVPPEDRPDEPEVWDGARVRDSERRYGASGRTQIVAAARHRGTGELVGYTFLSVARQTPETAYREPSSSPSTVGTASACCSRQTHCSGCGRRPRRRAAS